MQITMIGHSTLLIETQGKRILTDPFFNPFGNLGYKRVTPPSRSREDLADVDLVLLSHSHFDHIDRPLFRSLSPHVPVLAPTRMLFPFSGIGKRLLRGEIWKRYSFGEIAVTPVPAVHVAVTNGFVIESESLRIYFAGDTYLHPFMKTLREKFTLNVALMPVTTFRLPMTMGEKQAVEAVHVLEPEVVIPIHLGIQPRFPLMRSGQTPESFAAKLLSSGSQTRVIVLKEGRSWSSEQ